MFQLEFGNLPGTSGPAPVLIHRLHLFTSCFGQVKDQNLQKQYPLRFRFKVKLYPEDVAVNLIQDITLVSQPLISLAN